MRDQDWFGRGIMLHFDENRPHKFLENHPNDADAVVEFH